MLDSGAEGLFINKSFVREHWIRTKPLEKPIMAKNVDNTINRQGCITSYVELPIKLGETEHTERFLVTALGHHEIILGLPWLAKHNPKVNWETREITLGVTVRPGIPLFSLCHPMYRLT